MDTLLYSLEQMIAYYMDRYLRQTVGFEGPNLEEQRQRHIEKEAHKIDRDQIKAVSEIIYLVQSQSTPGVVYSVDTEEYVCDCPAF
ncbi:hypothetical protein FA95DRAFT_1641099, partial [Auriscalpium vulgare]